MEGPESTFSPSPLSAQRSSRLEVPQWSLCHTKCHKEKHMPPLGFFLVTLLDFFRQFFNGNRKANIKLQRESLLTYLLALFPNDINDLFKHPELFACSQSNMRCACISLSISCLCPQWSWHTEGTRRGHVTMERG